MLVLRTSLTVCCELLSDFVYSFFEHNIHIKEVIKILSCELLSDFVYSFFEHNVHCLFTGSQYGCELLSDFVYSFFEHNRICVERWGTTTYDRCSRIKKIRLLPDFLIWACGFSEQFQLDAFFWKTFWFLRVEEFHCGELLVGYAENSNFPFGRKERLCPLYVDIRILRTCTVTKIDGILEHYEAVAHQLLAELRRSFNLLLCVGRQIKKHHNPHNTILTYPFWAGHCKIGYM